MRQRRRLFRACAFDDRDGLFRCNSVVALQQPERSLAQFALVLALDPFSQRFPEQDLGTSQILRERWRRFCMVLARFPEGGDDFREELVVFFSRSPSCCSRDRIRAVMSPLQILHTFLLSQGGEVRRIFRQAPPPARENV